MIPLIRSGAILPFVHWMQANRQPADGRLREVDLGYVLKGDATTPIPLAHAIAFLRNASRAEGPDFACRIVSGSSVRELGMIGEVALGAASVRQALFRVAVALPYHLTHGSISVHSIGAGVLVREAWGMRIDGEDLHMAQQYVAALMQALCAQAGAPLPVFGRVALVPHPVHGLSHLGRHFGAAIEASPDRSLELFVPESVADRALRISDREGPAPGLETPPSPLRGDGTLGTSVRTVMAAMLSDGTPTLERIATAAGVSVRTLQRRLADEATSFSTLMDTVRRDRALEDLKGGDRSAREIAGALGYREQSSLTRAVRRWTGKPPRSLVRTRKP
jgi:AraC-like DNA-binding protein